MKETVPRDGGTEAALDNQNAPIRKNVACFLALRPAPCARDPRTGYSVSLNPSYASRTPAGSVASNGP